MVITVEYTMNHHRLFPKRICMAIDVIVRKKNPSDIFHINFLMQKLPLFGCVIKFYSDADSRINNFNASPIRVQLRLRCSRGHMHAEK